MGTRAHPANHRSQPPCDGQKNGHQQNHADESAPRSQIGIQSSGDQRPQRAAAPAQPVAFADGVRPAQGNLPALHGAPDGFMHEKQAYAPPPERRKITADPPRPARGKPAFPPRPRALKIQKYAGARGEITNRSPNSPCSTLRNAESIPSVRGKGHHINTSETSIPPAKSRRSAPRGISAVPPPAQGFFFEQPPSEPANQLFLHLILYFHFLPDSIAGARRNWALI